MRRLKQAFQRPITLLCVPFAVLFVFLIGVRLFSRELRLDAYYLFFAYVLWLLFPYTAFATYCTFREFSARRTFNGVAAAIATIGSIVALYGFYVEPSRLLVRETTISFERPARFALVSDLHVGMYQNEKQVAKLVRALNQLDIDAVLVAGDWTYEPRQPLAQLLEPFAHCRHRVFSVPGNHDEERPGPNLRTELRSALIKHGVTPIEGTARDFNGIQIVGLGDRWAGKDYVPEFDPKLPTIALAHNPDSIAQLTGTPIGLLLAGHTHGGQIDLPLFSLWKLKGITREGFVRGLYDRYGKRVFVTSGTGMTSIPMRLFQPPVIDIVNLR
jgi:uncharacterized protein